MTTIVAFSIGFNQLPWYNGLVSVFAEFTERLRVWEEILETNYMDFTYVET